MIIRKFAINLLNEVAEECDNRLILEMTDSDDVLSKTAQEATELIKLLVETPPDYI